MVAKYIRVEMKIQIGNETRHCEFSGEYPDFLASTDFVKRQIGDVAKAMSGQVNLFQSDRRNK